MSEGTPEREPVNKLAIALAVMAAMRDKPVAFQWPTRWSDPSYLGDGPWGP